MSPVVNGGVGCLVSLCSQCGFCTLCVTRTAQVSHSSESGSPNGQKNGLLLVSEIRWACFTFCRHSGMLDPGLEFYNFFYIF